VEDSLLGFADEKLLKEADRLLDHGQRLLAIERRPIREDLEGDERVWIRNVPAHVELDRAIEWSARSNNFPECSQRLVGFLRPAFHLEAYDDHCSSSCECRGGRSQDRGDSSLADVVPDIEGLADALGVGQFAVAGGSRGGPHALASPALLGDCVLRCLASASIAPYGVEGLDWLAGMTGGNVDEFNAGLAGADAIRPIAERERTTMFEQLMAVMTSSATGTSCPQPTKPRWRNTAT
jgi:pimeloyl-ACP methyl ester carboxylesterase